MLDYDDVAHELEAQLDLDRRSFLRLAAGVSAVGWLGIQSDPALAARAGDLQWQINTYVKNLRRQGRVRSDERTAWSVYDFTSGKKLVSINEDRPFQSASMIKPFVAQAYFYRHGESSQRYPYDATVRRKMTAMIRDSSNSATNYFIDRISNKPASRRPREVERVLKRHAGNIFQHTNIVEYIPRNGRSYRNRASARDYSRFLYAMWRNKLPYAGEVKYLMGLPNRDRIRRNVAAMPTITEVYDKTGSTARLCGNMGILAAHGRDGQIYPYIFVGIIEKSRRAKRYGRWIRNRGDIIRDISGMVYRSMQKQHNLV